VRRSLGLRKDYFADWQSAARGATTLGSEILISADATVRRKSHYKVCGCPDRSGSKGGI